MHCNFICGLSDVIIKTFSQSVIIPLMIDSIRPLTENQNIITSTLDLLTVRPKFTRPACHMQSTSAHRPPLRGFATAARAFSGTENG